MLFAIFMLLSLVSCTFTTLPSSSVEDTEVTSKSHVSQRKSPLPDPPPHDQGAKVARFIVQHSEWASIATISTRNPIKGYPFANVLSVSDGPVGNSTGIPYMYVTDLHLSVMDLQSDDRASLTMSLAQSDYCQRKDYDPEDPRCAHVMLTGHFVRISNSSSEYDFAKEALFSRHPQMKHWPNLNHNWFFAKLDVKNVLFFAYFGGAKTVSTKDYLSLNAI